MDELLIDKISIRWLIRRDMQSVMEIERSTLPPELQCTEDDILGNLRQRNCIGMVAEADDHVFGYMVYELHKTKLRLLSIGVHGDHRRRGCGRSMIDRLKSKLSQQRREKLEATVPGRCLECLVFLREMGFVSNGIEYPEGRLGEDYVNMVYRLGWD